MPSKKLALAKTLFCVAACGFAAGSLFSFPLWLDSPVRLNPHDPKSSLHIFATATLAGTRTSTPTFSMSPTQSATPTVSSSFTASPTPSFSPTASATPVSFMYYDGENSGSSVAVGGSTNSSCDTAGTISINEVAGSGAGGSGHFLEIAFTAPGPDTHWGQAAFVNQNNPMDASTYDTLSFYMRIPSSACPGVFRPMVQLNTNANGYPNDRSNPVTVTAYVVGGGGLGYDQWVHVLVPLAAMVGPNWNGGTFPAADLASIVGVQFRGWEGYGAGHGMYDPPNGGLFTGTAKLDVDQIEFLKMGVGAVPLRDVSPLFDDFQLLNDTLWNSGPWTVDVDGMTCAPTVPTSVIFPTGSNAAVDTSWDSAACKAGHFKGALNASPDTVCNTDLPRARIFTFLNPGGWDTPGMDVSGNPGAALKAFFPTGAKGLSVRIAVGAKTGQCYEVHLGTVDSYNQPGRNDFMFMVCDSDFSAINTWKTYNVDFPADGTAPGFNADPHPYTTTHLFWTQGPDGGLGTLNFDRTQLHMMAFSAMNGGAFDLWISQVSFY